MFQIRTHSVQQTFSVNITVNQDNQIILGLAVADVKTQLNKTVTSITQLISQIQEEHITLKGVTREALEKKPELRELQSEHGVLVFYERQQAAKAGALAPKSKVPQEDRLPEFMLYSVPGAATARQIVSVFGRQDISVEVSNIQQVKAGQTSTNAWITPQTRADRNKLLKAWSAKNGKSVVSLKQSPIHMNLPTIKLTSTGRSALPTKQVVEKALTQAKSDPLCKNKPNIRINTKDNSVDVTAKSLEDFNKLSKSSNVYCGPQMFKAEVVFGRRKHGARKNSVVSLEQQLSDTCAIILVAESAGNLQLVSTYLQQQQRQAALVTLRLMEPQDIFVTRCGTDRVLAMC